MNLSLVWNTLTASQLTLTKFRKTLQGQSFWWRGAVVLTLASFQVGYLHMGEFNVPSGIVIPCTCILVCVAELIVRSALKRKESRGLHYTLDFPDLAEEAVNTMVPPLRR